MQLISILVPVLSCTREWRVLGRKRARGRLGRWGCFGVGGEEVGWDIDNKEGSDNKPIGL